MRRVDEPPIRPRAVLESAEARERELGAAFDLLEAHFRDGVELRWARPPARWRARLMRALGFSQVPVITRESASRGFAHRWARSVSVPSGARRVHYVVDLTVADDPTGRRPPPARGSGRRPPRVRRAFSHD